MDDIDIRYVASSRLFNSKLLGRVNLLHAQTTFSSILLSCPLPDFITTTQTNLSRRFKTISTTCPDVLKPLIFSGRDSTGVYDFPEVQVANFCVNLARFARQGKLGEISGVELNPN